MSEFEGYGKISESSSHWILDKSDNTIFKRTLWCVTEKIHGANFCFVCDNNGERIRYGKRTSLLSDTDEFFGYKRRLFNEIIPKIQSLYQYVKTSYTNLEKLYIFGELFGGYYPHEDIQKIPNINPIQTGIWYCPDIEYYAFDLAIILNNKQIYLDYEFSLKAFQYINLFHAEPLFIGKYEEAIDYKLGFNSSIPNKLGLPLLNEENKAEGIVIKPMHEIMIKTNKGLLVRAIIKKKIEEFSEIKYSQAEKHELKSDGNLSNLDLLRFEIDPLITENRLNNAISKIGHVTENEKEKLKELLNLYVKDIIDQLYENGNENMWNELSSIDRDSLINEITLNAKKMIIKYLKKNKNK